jgi:hypothetical protein
MTTPKVNVFMNLYEEKEHIVEALDSVSRMASLLWILDGTVKQFPAKPDDKSFAEAAASRDGTVELIKEWMKTHRLPVHFWESKSIWESEADKKNFLLDKIPEGELTIQVDGDEEVYGSVTDIPPSPRNEFLLPILFKGHASFKPLEYAVFKQPRAFLGSRFRRFVPPNKKQLITFGTFSSSPIPKVVERPADPQVVTRPNFSLPAIRPTDPAKFSGNEEALKQNPPPTETPTLPIYIVNNPSLRGIERQKRRLIYYERIFEGVKFL